MGGHQKQRLAAVHLRRIRRLGQQQLELEFGVFARLQRCDSEVFDGEDGLAEPRRDVLHELGVAGTFLFFVCCVLRCMYDYVFGVMCISISVNIRISLHALTLSRTSRRTSC